MRTFALSLGAALLLAATSSATAASQTLDKATIEKLKGNPTAFAAPKMRQTGLLSTNGLQNCSIAPKSVTNEGTSIGPTSYWGTLKGPDGNEWLYTQEVTVVEGTYGDVDSSTITVYNARCQKGFCSDIEKMLKDFFESEELFFGFYRTDSLNITSKRTEDLK